MLKYPGGERIASHLFRIMKLDKINKAYGKIYELPPDEFIDAVIKELGIPFRVLPDEGQNIPKNGPFITISNHAYGGIDGIILLKILPSVRPDFKVLINFLLAKIKPIESFGFTVNPFERLPQVKKSRSGSAGRFWLGTS
jgi:hypothetical protein